MSPIPSQYDQKATIPVDLKLFPGLPYYTQGIWRKKYPYVTAHCGFYIQFRQSFTKETFSYDERLKNEKLKYESHKACSNSETGMLRTF